MVHWVYILECEDGVTYIGETSRLFSRFDQHLIGMGCKSTYNKSMLNIGCIYKLDNLMNFFEYNQRLDYYAKEEKYKKYHSFKNNALDFYDSGTKWNFSESSNLQSENFIVERMLLEDKQLKFDENFNINGSIKGGKYIREDVTYTNINSKELLTNYPLCNCGFPCDVRKNDKNEVYFRCAKKNFWEDMIESFDIENYKPCDFYKKYTKGEDVKKLLAQQGVKIIEKSKIYLQVPYKEKEVAKTLGCKWDPEKRQWYCGTIDLEAIKKYGY